MKITALTENTCPAGNFDTEHGLSLYLETGIHKVLFDFGRSSLFAENSKKLGINLSDVDIAILSHGHYDHADGIPAFLEINHKAPIYINEHGFGPHYFKNGRYIGVKKEICVSEELGARTVFTNDYTKLDEGLELFTYNGASAVYETETYGIVKMEEGRLVPDDFSHEQYLLVTEGDKRILISGCSHKGILNIAAWAKPGVLIGGFHFKDVALDEEGCSFLKEAAEALKKFDTMYYTCHCTGKEQYEIMKKYMGEKLSYIACGDTITI